MWPPNKAKTNKKNRKKLCLTLTRMNWGRRDWMKEGPVKLRGRRMRRQKVKSEFERGKGVSNVE